MKNITKTTQTILFAGLIAAMILPFSGMEFAAAEEQTVIITNIFPEDDQVTLNWETNINDRLIATHVYYFKTATHEDYFLTLENPKQTSIVITGLDTKEEYAFIVSVVSIDDNGDASFISSNTHYAIPDGLIDGVPVPNFPITLTTNHMDILYTDNIARWVTLEWDFSYNPHRQNCLLSHNLYLVEHEGDPEIGWHLFEISEKPVIYPNALDIDEFQDVKEFAIIDCEGSIDIKMENIRVADNQGNAYTGLYSVFYQDIKEPFVSLYSDESQSLQLLDEAVFEWDHLNDLSPLKKEHSDGTPLIWTLNDTGIYIYRYLPSE